MLNGCFPVRFIKSTGCEDNAVSVLLSSKMEGTAIVELNQSLETAADNSLVHGVLVLSVVGDLQHHSADEVAAVKNLQVNLHMEGNLSLVFLKLIFASFVQLSAETLSKEFLVLGVVANIGKQVVSLLDSAKSEGSKTSLGEGTIVENLIIDHVAVGINVRLQHDVFGIT